MLPTDGRGRRTFHQLLWDPVGIVGEEHAARWVEAVSHQRPEGPKAFGRDFQTAFSRSSNQVDYRWGRFHRVTLDHPLGGPFNIPPAFGAFPPPLADLPGIPTDGGFETVDASTHDVRADATGEFGFGGGPANRYVSEPRAPGDIRAESSLPGGPSGVPGSPFYVNLLGEWLTNDTFTWQP